MQHEGSGTAARKGFTLNAGAHTMASAGPTEMAMPRMAPPHIRLTNDSAPARRAATPRRVSNSCMVDRWTAARQSVMVDNAAPHHVDT